jgi:hypothetical protein
MLHLCFDRLYLVADLLATDDWNSLLLTQLSFDASGNLLVKFPNRINLNFLDQKLPGYVTPEMKGLN